MAQGEAWAAAASPPARRRGWWAGGAVGVVLVFLGITCWWLARDRGVPFADAASHLFTVVVFHDLILEGDLGRLWHRSYFYPPTTFLVGTAGIFVGGLNPDAPVLAQNLVYVPLLAIGCYQTARLFAGEQAGFLAVVFALGSPLLIEQFHVFMIDAPQAALVAFSVWLILLSERFSRLGVSALAGVAVGAGLASKPQFPLFVTGLLVVLVARGRGWRNWRGIGAFLAIAILVGAPWYVANLSHLGLLTSAAEGPNVPPAGRPPLLSLANLGWYLWAVLNGVLFAPLFAFAAVGLLRAAKQVATGRAIRRDAGRGDLLPELLAGLSIGWLGISATPHHDMRYAMPLLVYLAVLGTAWIPSLPRLARRAAVAALLLAVMATTLGMSFGVGPDVRLVLGGTSNPIYASWGIPPSSQITFHANHDFNVSAPRRGDDVLGLLVALRRDGVTGVASQGLQAPLGDPVFDVQGFLVFARFAHLTAPDPNGAKVATSDPPAGYAPPVDGGRWLRRWWNVEDPDHVFLIRQGSFGNAKPCIRLRDGTGLWLQRGSAPRVDAPTYCPLLA